MASPMRVSPCRGMWRLIGYKHGDVRKVITMRTQQKWIGMIVMLAALLLISAVPGHTDRGGHGYRGHGYRDHGHRGPYRYGGPRVFISPRLVVPFGPYWRPYWEPYGYHQSSSRHPHASMSNPYRQWLPSLLPRHIGTIARTPKPTTRMSNSAQGDGGR
jgi:hypothetical protein